MKFYNNYYEPYKDLFAYYQELKQINPGYRLFFNKITKKFEIVNTNNNFEKCFEFNSIFEINLQELRFLKIENLNNILSMIDNNNSKIEQNNSILNKNKSMSAFNEFNKLSNRSTKINNTDINKIIGAT